MLAFPTRVYRRTMAAIPAKPAKPAMAIWVASLLPEELVPLPPEPPAEEEPPLLPEDVLAEPMEVVIEPPI